MGMIQQIINEAKAVEHETISSEEDTQMRSRTSSAIRDQSQAGDQLRGNSGTKRLPRNEFDSERLLALEAGSKALAVFVRRRCS